jgi:hypothetical protein
MVPDDSFRARPLTNSSLEQPGRSSPFGNDSDNNAHHRRGRDSCRVRMISFRVSEREFEQLLVRSEAEGARNISEYARNALCEGPKLSEADLRRLTAEIQRIGADVARVTELIEQRGPVAAPDPEGRD